jgi:hypothetical protein
MLFDTRAFRLLEPVADQTSQQGQVLSSFRVPGTIIFEEENFAALLVILPAQIRVAKYGKWREKSSPVFEYWENEETWSLHRPTWPLRNARESESRGGSFPFFSCFTSSLSWIA